MLGINTLVGGLHWHCGGLDPARHIGREGPSLAFRVMGKGVRPEGPKPEAKKAESREWG